MTETPNFNKLPVLCSARVRLDAEQRETLKDAYFNQRESVASKNTTGNLQVTTAVSSNAERETGLNHLVLMDILNSRDTINLPLMVNLQNTLGVEVISRQQLEDAFQSYLDYVLNK